MTPSKRAQQIKLAIFDVDGVLTDGTLWIGSKGEQYKSFSTRDGLGLRLLKQTGVELAIITARESNALKHRMDELAIEHVYQGQKDKLKAYHSLLAQLSLTSEQVAYTGDDIIDIPVMRHTGLSIAVRDAEPLAKAHAHWITPRRGGAGAVRDVCEFIMRCQGTFDGVVQKYLGT